MCSLDKKEKNTDIENSSPFDIPKLCQYEFIDNYLLKKAEQLFEAKNYHKAVEEFKALLECAVKNDDTAMAKELEEKILKAESSLSLREESRVELQGLLYKPGNSDGNIIEQGIENIKKFILEARLHEEYYILMKKITDFHLKNIKNESALKNLISLLVTFDPLKYVIEISSIEAEANSDSFILFDLDSTLFDNSPRVHKIMMDFVSARASEYPENELSKLAGFKREEIVWGIKQNLEKMGITDEKLKKDLIQYWFDRFFSNEYIIDEPLKGATKFVEELDKTGIKIIYLSGRIENMRKGTERNILAHGLPLKKNEHLLLKPDMGIADHTFKHETLEKLKNKGNMIAGFDNEPLNVNIFQDHFPESEVFFLETNHSVDPPNLYKGIHTIRNFELG